MLRFCASGFTLLLQIVNLRFTPGRGWLCKLCNDHWRAHTAPVVLRLMLKYLLTLVAFFCIVNGVLAQEQKGKIAGTVKEKGSNEPLIGAAIRIDGTSTGASSDLDGRFTLTVAPGTYSVIVSMVGLANRRIDNVVVRENETTIIPPVFMEEAATETDVVEVVSTIKKGSAEAIFAEQRNMTVVSSGISADQIRRTPDRTTADALRRVSGASIQEGRFAIVRGLADRYNMGMINNSIFPSTESDRKAFSLELIPANVLESIMILKTATPDQPTDWAGGLIAIKTRDIPFENQISVTAGLGSHSLTTGKAFQLSPRGGTDFLGIDDGSRKLPVAGLTKTQIEQQYGGSPQGKADLARRFSHRFVPQSIASAMPDQTLNIGASRRMQLFGNELGLVYGLTYQRRFRNTPLFSHRPNINVMTQESVSNPIDGDSINSNIYRSITTTGQIFNLAYKVGNYTKFSFKNFYSINTDDQVIERSSVNRVSVSLDDDVKGQDVTRRNETVILYKQDRLYAPQFNAEHIINPSGLNLRLDYTLGYNDILRQVPDYRMHAFRNEWKAGEPEPFTGVAIDQKVSAYLPFNNFRYFSTLAEKAYQASANVTLPLDSLLGWQRSSIKAGFLYHDRNRQFNARTFQYEINTNNDGLMNLPADQLYNEENLVAGKLGLVENTRGSDRYKAASKMRAAYIMLDVYDSQRLHVLGGLRAESYYQRVYDTDFASKINVDTSQLNFLPSFNVIYALTENSNLRFSASKSLNRPEFRELAPAQFYEFNFNALQVGNPRLKIAEIYNYDLKYEIFPTEGTTFSINPFYKRFLNPIEIYVESNSAYNTYTYKNSRSAQVFGLELETRLNAQLIDKEVKGLASRFSVFGNLSFMKSETYLGPKGESGYDFERRALQGQSPYIINTGLSYNHPEQELDVTLSLNRYGRRLFFVSTNERDMFWEQARTVIDLSVTKTFKRRLQVRAVLGDLLAQNLVIYKDLNLNKKYDAGSDVTSQLFRNGFTTQINVTWKF